MMIRCAMPLRRAINRLSTGVATTITRLVRDPVITIAVTIAGAATSSAMRSGCWQHQATGMANKPMAIPRAAELGS